MSIDIYYTLRSNKKSYYFADTLFFGRKKFYDYKKIVEEVFDTYDDCLNKAVELDLSEFIVRKHVSTSGGITTKDYRYNRNRIRRR